MRFRRDISGAHEHLQALAEPLAGLEPELQRIEEWGERIGRVLLAGGRLLAVGNGGSAAEAQHLTAELVGRYREERLPLSAIALHAESSSLTAIGNDYGPEEAFARQVRAHGRPGDVLLALSTSGRSENVLAAVEAGRRTRMHTLALTGPGPNPLSGACDGAVEVEAESAATVQEIHLIVVHLLCGTVDRLCVAAGAARRQAVSG